jgi:hypothetical protein
MYPVVRSPQKKQNDEGFGPFGTSVPLTTHYELLYVFFSGPNMSKAKEIVCVWVLTLTYKYSY